MNPDQAFYFAFAILLQSINYQHATVTNVCLFHPVLEMGKEEDGGIYIEFVWIIPCPAQSWFDIHYNNPTHRLTTALHSSCGHLLYCVFCSSAQLSIIFFSPTFSRPRVGQAIAVANHTC